MFENLSQPKRAGFLFDKAFTKQALLSAYFDARKMKRKKVECYQFELALGAEIEKLHQELMCGSYRPRPLKQFEVFEPKRRVIHAPHFRDLVVQHAIYRVIYPIFDRTFIDQSYACRKGGGTHKASDYLQRSMRKHKGDAYYVQLDIKKFFYSVDRAILRKQFERKIKDKRFVDLMCLFAEMDTPKGIPIGNLLSQVYALVYLNPLDHFVKRTLKVSHYVRYVDDFILVGLTLEQAKEFKSLCERFVKTKLKLELSKWRIAKINHGINFVGYRTWRSNKYVRRHSLAKMRKAIKQNAIESLVSLLSHARHSSTLIYYSHLLWRNDFIEKLTKRSKKLCLNILNLHPAKTNSQPCVLSTQGRMS